MSDTKYTKNFIIHKSYKLTCHKKKKSNPYKLN